MNPEPTGYEPILTLAAVVAAVVAYRFARAVINTLRRREDAAGAGDFLYALLEGGREAGALIAQHGRMFAGLRRAGAIALNSVREAVRRRLLWIVPAWLAVTLGVAAFIKPLDEEQDRYALLMKLFLYGQLAMVAGAITLSAVADIGNERRRKTLLTLLVKPVTRLEFVIGKIAGQSLIAAVLLGFTTAATGLYFVRLDAGIRSDAQERYDQAKRLHDEDPVRRAPDPSLAVLADEGVLSIREIRPPFDLRLTALDRDGLTWLRAGSGQRAAALFPPVRGSPDRPPMIVANFRALPIMHMLLRDRPDRVRAGRFGVDLSFTATIVPLSDPRRTVTVPYPLVMSEELREEFAPILEREQRLKVGAERVFIEAGVEREFNVTALFPMPLSMMGFTDGEGRRLDAGRIEINVACNHTGFYLGIRPEDSIYISGVSSETPGAQGGVLLPPDPVEMRGTQLRKRQSIMGIADHQNPEFVSPFPLRQTPVLYYPDKAIWRFPGIRPDDLEEGRPPELRIRGIVDVNEQFFSETLVRLDFAHLDGQPVWQVERTIEENRPLIIRLPEQLVTGRPFIATMTCRSTGHSIALDFNSAQLSVSRQSFPVALLRSAAIIWMQATVLAAVGVFASTFLSWPVGLLATGFTLLLGVVKPMLLPLGVGHELWRALYVMDPQTVETWFLTGLKWLVWMQGRLIAATAFVAPDLREFGEFDLIARGVAVPMREFLRDALWAGLYVLPMLLAAYWIMRWKEAGE